MGGEKASLRQQRSELEDQHAELTSREEKLRLLDDKVRCDSEVESDALCSDCQDIVRSFDTIRYKTVPLHAVGRVHCVRLLLRVRTA